MTTPASGRKFTTACNGVTKVFNAPEAINASDVAVYLLDAIDAANVDGTLLAQDVDYTVAGDFRAGNGQITTTVAYPAGKFIRRFRTSSRAQTNDYVPGDGFPADSHEKALDRLSLIDEEHDDDIASAVGDLADTSARAIRAPSGEVLLDMPVAATRSGNFMQWAAGGLSLLMLSASSMVIAIAPQLQAYIGGIAKGDPGGNALAIGAFEAAGGLSIPVGTDAVRTSGYFAVSPGKGIADYSYDATVDAAYVAAHPRTSFRTVNGRGFKLTGILLSPAQTGGVGDGATDDKLALAAATSAGKPVLIDAPYTFRSTGGIVLPDGADIRGAGGTINFDASATAWLFALGADSTPLNVSNISIEKVHFTSSSDVGFMHIVRLSNTGTIDGFRFNWNVIDYTAAPSNSQDRWAMASSGVGGTRTNFQLIGNRITGPMQLCATAIGTQTIQHWEIRLNTLKNTRSNAIAVVTLGSLTGANTAEDITIADNDIYASQYTAVGIFVGIDGVSTDKCVAMRRFKISGNRINLTAAGQNQPDIFIRLGNKCANIGGFDSVADTFIVEDNDLYGGIQVTQDLPATASGTSLATNFLFKDNRIYGGDVSLYYLADGALLKDNRGYGAGVRLGLGCGRVGSQNNRWRNFNPAVTTAQFTWDASGDVYTGQLTGTDRVVFFNSTVPGAQTGIFKNCTIDSYTSGSPYCAISVNGTGAPSVTVYNLTSSTTWASGGKFERVSGTITDMTGGETFTAINIDPVSLVPGAATAEFTLANVMGANVGDFVVASFSNDLKGIQIIARVTAANTIKYYFQNPNGNPNGTIDLGIGNVRFRFYARTA